MASETTIISAPNVSMNRLAYEDAAIHDWYRFVLSYPPHLVRYYFERFDLSSKSMVLDPFCGTGTTLVEAKKHSIGSVGIEGHPMTSFASATKVDWSPDPMDLLEHAERVADIATASLERSGVPDSLHRRLLEEPESGTPSPELRDLPSEANKLLLKNSISPRPLHKALALSEAMQDNIDVRFHAHEQLAFAKTLVFSSSNLRFGPEVGVGKPKLDAAVVVPWLDNIRVMCSDLQKYRADAPRKASSTVIEADSRDLKQRLPMNCVDAVICSPPYPNEKDYTRTTRLESVLLGFVQSKAELRTIKKGLIRSNTRTVYKDDADDHFIQSIPEIQRIADEIEERRIALGKDSGFERLYPRVTKLYFGGMARHLSDLKYCLRPGAQLAYVVGDQASYLRVMIRTGSLLARIAEQLGYEVTSIDLFRTRLSTATGEQLREEVVVLKWPG